MATVKIGPKHQVTIPRDVFAQLYLKPGRSGAYRKRTKYSFPG